MKYPTKENKIVRRTTLLILALVCLSAIAVSAADWATWRGPKADGFAPDKGINKDWNTNPPKMLWKVDLGDGGYAGPSCAAGKVFIIDHKEKNDIIRAIDVKTGKDVWTYTYEDADKPNYGFARSTPVFDKGGLFAISRLGILNVLDAKTGKLVWSKDICTEFKGQRPGWDYGWSPLIDGNKIIILPGGENAAVVALDRKTGKTIWQGGGSDKSGYATPVVAKINDKRQYVIFTNKVLEGIDPDNGNVLWSFPWKTGAECNAATPIVIGNSVFITTGYGHGCAMVDVTPEGAKSKWENKEMQAHFSSPILSGGYLYGTGDPGFLMCLDPATGTAKWKQTGFEKGAICGVDGTILGFDGGGGDLMAVSISPDAYKELGRFKPLGGQSWTAPIVANGMLIVRNTKSLACFSLK